MAQEQHQQPVETAHESPRTERMTAAESRAVIDLWQSERTEQTGLTDRPAVPDVAEGLDITVEDVHRLLLEVRARRLEEERALAVEQELSEIRLAEEERKLAEVRRQRAEMQREQAETMRRQFNSETMPFAPMNAVEKQRENNSYALVVIAIFLTICLLIMVVVANQPGGGQ